MILTLQMEGTDAFKFDLEQADIIYMMGYAQQHVIQKTENAEGESKTLQAKAPETSIYKLDNGENITKKWEEDKSQLIRTDGKYTGFLLIRCEECGDVRGFCSKKPIDTYICNECGHQTQLANMRAAYLDCECGRHFKYMTNETSEVITWNCLDCGREIDAMLNSRRTAYTTVSDPRLGGSTKIRAFGGRW